MRILDFHTHAFPDAIAERAIAALIKSAHDGITSETNGTVSGLLEIMDRFGVEKSVVANIATKPAQSKNIVDWSLQVRTDRILPFGSVHPDTTDPIADVEQIQNAGLKGIKLHPFYQNFAADDPRMFPVYDAVAQAGLPLLFHAGYDIAFGDSDLAAPHRFVTVLKNFPKLHVVLAHFGGWNLYSEFLETLAGKSVTIDTSFTAGYCPDSTRDAILKKHDLNRIVFASDSPWGGLKNQIDYVAQMPLPDSIKERIFWHNAAEMLGEK